MTNTTLAEQLDAMAAEFRRGAHDADMGLAMALTERLLGVPYGPALCEVHPSKVRGIEP